jgi:hypothetical protein
MKTVKTFENGTAVKHSNGGWGMDYNYGTSRKYAAFDASGSALRQSNGSIRTFGSVASATAALEVAQ